MKIYLRAQKNIGKLTDIPLLITAQFSRKKEVVIGF